MVVHAMYGYKPYMVCTKSIFAQQIGQPSARRSTDAPHCPPHPTHTVCPQGMNAEVWLPSTNTSRQIGHSGGFEGFECLGGAGVVGASLPARCMSS